MLLAAGALVAPTVWAASAAAHDADQPLATLSKGSGSGGGEDDEDNSGPGGGGDDDDGDDDSGNTDNTGTGGATDQGNDTSATNDDTAGTTAGTGASVTDTGTGKGGATDRGGDTSANGDRQLPAPPPERAPRRPTPARTRAAPPTAAATPLRTATTPAGTTAGTGASATRHGLETEGLRGGPAQAGPLAALVSCHSDRAETIAQTPSSSRKPYWLSTAASTARMIEPIRFSHR